MSATVSRRPLRVIAALAFALAACSDTGLPANTQFTCTSDGAGQCPGGYRCDVGPDGGVCVFEGTSAGAIGTTAAATAAATGSSGPQTSGTTAAATSSATSTGVATTAGAQTSGTSSGSTSAAAVSSSASSASAASGTSTGALGTSGVAATGTSASTSASGSGTTATTTSGSSSGTSSTSSGGTQCTDIVGVYSVSIQGMGCGDLDPTAKQCISFVSGVGCNYLFVSRKDPDGGQALNGAFVEPVTDVFAPDGGIYEGSLSNPPRSGCIIEYDPASLTFDVTCGNIVSGCGSSGMVTPQCCSALLTFQDAGSCG